MGTAMAGYRAYFMSADGHIRSREEFLADSDQAAIKKASEFFELRPECPACEVWQEKRKVHRIDRQV